MEKEKNQTTIHSSAAEYLTYVAAVGDNANSMEIRYEEENIWLTQKMLVESSRLFLVKNIDIELEPFRKEHLES